MLPEIEELAAVVVCDDDEPTRRLLCDHLTADRYKAMPAECASDALRLCTYEQPDLMILDVGLPDASGLDVLRELRRQSGTAAKFDPDLPVIVLSGRSSPTDRVRGLDLGADDYVTKPFGYPELAARVRRVLARRESRRLGPVRVGDLVVDPARREATVGGEKVRLSSTEFTLLRTLAAEPNRVFSKEELLRDVWGFRSLGRTRTLDTHASRLRRKLDPENTRYVRNCWGVGYRLVDD
jgi:DNA-binding response OmpR family regulator